MSNIRSVTVAKLHPAHHGVLGDRVSRYEPQRGPSSSVHGHHCVRILSLPLTKCCYTDLD